MTAMLGVTLKLARSHWNPSDAKLISVGDGTMKYKVALQHSDEGYSVSVPGLPGCWSQWKTEAEAIANVREAIREYLVVRDELLGAADLRETEVG